jgi:hypothetical protein
VDWNCPVWWSRHAVDAWAKASADMYCGYLEALPAFLACLDQADDQPAVIVGQQAALTQMAQDSFARCRQQLPDFRSRGPRA